VELWLVMDALAFGATRQVCLSAQAVRRCCFLEFYAEPSDCGLTRGPRCHNGSFCLRTLEKMTGTL
jgi:hypothetical protein